MQKFEGSSIFLRLGPIGITWGGASGAAAPPPKPTGHRHPSGAIVVSGWIGYDRDGAFVLKGAAVSENRNHLD